MRGGFRGRDRDIVVTKEDIDRAFKKSNLDPDEEFIDDLPEYDHNGNIKKETEPYIPERSTGQILSNVERKAWMEKIKAMSPTERSIAIRGFTDEEIFNELKRRLEVAENNVKRVRDALGYEGEEY